MIYDQDTCTKNSLANVSGGGFVVFSIDFPMKMKVVVKHDFEIFFQGHAIANEFIIIGLASN